MWHEEKNQHLELYCRDCLASCYERHSIQYIYAAAAKYAEKWVYKIEEVCSGYKACATIECSGQDVKDTKY